MNPTQRFFYKHGIQGIITNVLRDIIEIKGKGRRNIPSRGSALVVANHRCWLDPLFLAAVIKRPITFCGVDFHFKIPVVRQFCSLAGILPVSIEGGKKSSVFLNAAVDELNSRKNIFVGIFPEGVSNFINPSYDEKIIRFHTGFARIALEAKVPIIPAAIIPAKEKLLTEVPGKLVSLFTPLEKFSHGAKLIIYEYRVTVNIGKPIYLDKYYNKEIDKDLLYDITKKARDTVIELYKNFKIL